MAEVITITSTTGIEHVLTGEAAQEGRVVKELAESVSATLFNTRGIPESSLGEVQNQIAVDLTAELVRVAVERIKLSRNSKLAAGLSSFEQSVFQNKIERSVVREMHDLGLNLNDATSSAIESVADYARNRASRNMEKTNFAHDLKGSQLKRVDTLGMPFIGATILEEARARMWQFMFKKSEVHEGNEMVDSIASPFEALMDTLDPGNESFGDVGKRDEAIAAIKKGIQEVVFGDHAAVPWEVRKEIKDLDTTAVDVLLDRFYFYRGGNFVDFFFPLNHDGKRHPNGPRFSAAITTVLLLGLVGCANYLNNTPTPKPPGSGTPSGPTPDHHTTPGSIVTSAPATPDSASATPSATTAPRITETPTPPMELSGRLPDVARLTGVAIDASTLTHTPSDGVQAELNTAGFGLVHAGSDLNTMLPSMPNTCFTALSQQITDRDTGLPLTLTSQFNGVATYENTLVVAEVPLPVIAGHQYTCAQIYKLSDGTIFNALFEMQSKGVPTLVATMKATFARGSNLVVLNNGVTLDNNPVQWIGLDGKEFNPPPVRPTYHEGLAIKSTEFTLLNSDEEEAAVVRDVIKNGTGLDINQDPMYISSKMKGPGFTFITIKCDLGINCNVGASIARTITLPDGSTQVIRKLIWQGIAQVNGVKKIITYKTNNEFYLSNSQPIAREETLYQLLSTATTFTGRFALGIDSSVTNPIARYVFDHEDPAIVQSLKDGIIPENLADTTFWVGSFIPQ
jgi:hypothetical protein